ncbi:peroxisomal leader peptide-processing protease [Silurus meridionalis]|uniref:peroxisomal leader peptide-processing protease n=1 Tax=Silurus meridionalis TaxID=175797 RepID=UPI001EEB4A89|nr:peroxisomal leader peptide-processing protease [Silurus meridionalis]
MSVEQMCCVVSVSENSCSETQESNGNPLSCSGVVLSHQSGLLLCSGLVLSRFLLDKECISQNPKILFADKFSSKIQIYIDYVDGKVDQGTNKRSNTNALPTCHKPAELLMMINCVEFQGAFQNLFTGSEQWKFTDCDEDRDIPYNSNFLSWFAVLKMTTNAQVDPVPWIKSTMLAKGCSVVACGSPFGSFCPDLFMSTLSKGIVSNLAGEENALILTDARCLPGTQGGGLFISDGDKFYLVGLITSPLCWKSNEWIGLTLVCSLHLILRNILQAVTSHQTLRQISTHTFTDIPHVTCDAHQNAENGNYPMVVVVECGHVWGSGIMLSPYLVLTCRHVVNGRQLLKVTLSTSQRSQTVSSRVLFSTKITSPYDIAVVQLQEPFPHVIVPQITTKFVPGEDVLVLGYGALGKTCGPSLTSGILSRVVHLQNKPVMLQTTCAVNCGASGGAVVRAKTGELLGIVSSNTRDFAAKVTYPHLNFSIPVTVLAPLLSRFAQTQDPAVFQELDSTEAEVRKVWRLQIPEREKN